MKEYVIQYYNHGAFKNIFSRDAFWGKKATVTKITGNYWKSPEITGNGRKLPIDH